MDLLPSSHKETCSEGAQMERYPQQKAEEGKKITHPQNFRYKEENR